ncbi:enoyl-CoA hydratase/isomerase family protein, partial [Corynebacterium sp.]|uniref:enoyl-CoA hydratase/isomerase family protein n=1 Tax=Corynebacterium sp. TaxID=1720 RepID=UPI0026DBABB9
MTNENNVISASPDGEVTLDILPVDNDTPTDGEPQPQVAVITIRRDHKRNSLNADVCGHIAAYVHEAENTDSVRAILLRGEGKAFCAGADLAGGVYTSAFHHNL